MLEEQEPYLSSHGNMYLSFEWHNDVSAGYCYYRESSSHSFHNDRYALFKLLYLKDVEIEEGLFAFVH